MIDMYPPLICLAVHDMCAGDYQWAQAHGHHHSYDPPLLKQGREHHFLSYAAQLMILNLDDAWAGCAHMNIIVKNSNDKGYLKQKQ